MSMVLYALAFLPLPSSKKISDHAVIFLVDISFSMLAQDVSPDRITAVSQALSQSLPSFPDAQYGITVFAWKPFPIVPLTPFPQFLQPFLEKLSPFNIQQTHRAELSGTAIGEALLSAIGQLQGKKNATIIIITDGDVNTGIDPRSLWDILRQHAIQLHLIAFGTHYSPELSFFDEQWKLIRPTDPKTGQATRVKTNFELLENIAHSLEANYYAAENKTALISVLTSIVSQFPKIYQDTHTPHRTLLIFAGIFFIITLILLIQYSAIPLIFTYNPQSFLLENSRWILQIKIIFWCIFGLFFILSLLLGGRSSTLATIWIIDRSLPPQDQRQFLEHFLKIFQKEAWIGIADNQNGGRILVPPTKDMNALKRRYTYEQQRNLQIPQKQTGIQTLNQSNTQFYLLNGKISKWVLLENFQNIPMLLGILLYISLCFPVLKFWQSRYW
jgi:von Willebrand factor type A domain